MRHFISFEIGDGIGLTDNCAVTPDQRDVDECGPGVYECTGDLATSCSTAARVPPVEEMTDGLDNDCDGTVDE